METVLYGSGEKKIPNTYKLEHRMEKYSYTSQILRSSSFLERAKGKIRLASFFRSVLQEWQILTKYKNQVMKLK